MWPSSASIAACVAEVLASWPATWYLTDVNDACTENDHCEFTGAMLPAMPIACAIVAAEWPLTLPIAAVAPKTVLE